MIKMDVKEKLSLDIYMLSLLVSIISIILARKANAKANTLSQERNELALRQARATEHALFVQRLHAVNKQLEDLLPNFRYKAEKAYADLTHVIDSYDKQRKNFPDLL